MTRLNKEQQRELQQKYCHGTVSNSQLEAFEIMKGIQINP